MARRKPANHGRAKAGRQRRQGAADLPSGSQKVSPLERCFAGLIERQCPDLFPVMQREFCFHPVRKWRFDFAWEGPLLAVEVEGGKWTRGRHQTPQGFQEDLEKYNAAALLGWTVLRYTRDDLLKRPMEVASEVLRGVQGR